MIEERQDWHMYVCVCVLAWLTWASVTAMKPTSEYKTDKNKMTNVLHVYVIDTVDNSNKLFN